MKRITPLKAKKNPSEMERYAKERAKSSRNPKPAIMTQALHEPMYDPESDLHYLTRAEEVKNSPARHKAAKQVAKRKMHDLSKIA